MNARYLTTVTGQGVWRITSAVTEPISALAIAPAPGEPITLASQRRAPAMRHLRHIGDTRRVEQSPRRSHRIATAGLLHGFDFARRHMAAEFRRIDRLLDVEQQELV